MLSIIIITKNEEANIRRCLESASFAAEIIVVDSGSTDQTVSIARQFTEHVYLSEDWQGYGIQKQRALNRATGDWVLNLDADESVDDALRDTIQKAISADNADGFRVPIQSIFYGKILRYSCSPSRHVRLFRRRGAAFSSDIVHEKIILPKGSRILRVKNSIRHHSFRDVSHALYKINKYSSCSALVRRETRPPPSLFRILFASTWMFFRSYLLQGGILDGRSGFLMAVFNAQGSFYRGIKQMYPDVS